MGYFCLAGTPRSPVFSTFLGMNDEIKKLAEECARKHSAHVIDVTIRGSRQKSIVEIFVDAEAGVTSDLCSTISRDVSEMLDVREMFKGSYQLVVSSPGIERPLKFSWQYGKHIGRTFLVKRIGKDTTEEQIGKLLAVGNETVTLEAAKGHEQVQIRFDEILEAIVRVPW
jgi:ribosome maturation factor RimP